MLATAVLSLTFLAGFLGIFGINLVLSDLFEQDLKEEAKRREELLRIKQRERVRDQLKTDPYAKHHTKQSASLSSLAAAAESELQEENRTTVEQWADWLEQSGTRWSMGKLCRVASLWGLVAGLIVWLIARSTWVGASVGTVAAVIPLLYLAWKRRQRMAKLVSQMPDALELMSRILRSGQTITQAMQSVALESSAPTSTEFGYCYEQQNLGLPLEVALKDLCRRTGVLEIKIFVLAILVHRTAGGNLAQLLDNLGRVVRARFTLRGKLRALTAEGRLQAIMLLALPPVVYALMLVMNTEYATKLLDHPRLIMGTLASMGIGAFFINRIVNFDF